MKFEKISPYDILIRHTSNGGCVVQVGCGEFAFSNPVEMMEAMSEFYKNPQEMIKHYNEANREQGREPICDERVQPDPYFRQEENCQCEAPDPRQAIGHGPSLSSR